MTFHQVFLPPPTLEPFPLSNQNQKSNQSLKLRFHTLHSSSTGISQGQSQSLSLRNRLGRRASTWMEFSQGGLESLERSTVLGKRLGRLDDIVESEGIRGINVRDQSLIGNKPVPIDENDTSRVKEGESEDNGRRRSKRTTRQSVSLLNTLPQIYPSAPDSANSHSQSESYDSLSTTTSSFPSQLLTNPGNTSVSNLPNWSIPLHKLTTLSTLLSSSGLRGIRIGGYHALIICILSTESIIQRQRKEEKAQNKDGTLFIGKWTITTQPSPGENEVTCIVRLWDDCAKMWGEKVRRGDVVLLENVELKPSTNKEPSHLSLSTHHLPKITILYRTLPRYETSRNDYIYQLPSKIGLPAHLSEQGGNTKGRILLEDKILRPDLRLGRSEVGVRKVEGVAKWFAGWVGGEGPV